ncbi:retropepsin-like aspartic protease family protein [Nostoc parmelioides]|uniref:Retroviral-like aspartic protease family protein n=1 Tax=Nostoc parmelioides FACHB-3921 TaxID=2692909 RepID=A0ABR8B8U3_9NOSO|nr:retropepsin-like aspartic protease [Nostoc parmelioides]MBD2250355.1 retroviral-like aspartic protease family protein [Nostoc parmelioides FACHB-3921]
MIKNDGRRETKNIRLGVISVIPTLLFLMFSHTVSAEDPGECFMITTSGRTIPLRKLCGGTKTFQNSEQRVFRVPIKRRLGRTPVIDVTFNDKKTFEMIVDTGANNTLIPLKLAIALQLQPTGIMKAQIADGTQVEFSTSQVKSIAAGGAIAKNIQVAIAPKAEFGLLGHDFFGNYDIKILETEVEFHPR